MDVVFLDANVLFSAAYRDTSPLGALWDLAGTELITSGYALDEARRNLSSVDQLRRLEALAGRLRVVQESGAWVLPRGVILPEKDRPILAAAVGAGATHLLTGDQAHFGSWYETRIAGVLVQRPAAYLRSRSGTDATPSE